MFGSRLVGFEFGCVWFWFGLRLGVFGRTSRSTTTVGGGGDGLWFVVYFEACV